MLELASESNQLSVCVNANTTLLRGRREPDYAHPAGNSP